MSVLLVFLETIWFVAWNCIIVVTLIVMKQSYNWLASNKYTSLFCFNVFNYCLGDCKTDSTNSSSQSQSWETFFCFASYYYLMSINKIIVQSVFLSLRLVSSSLMVEILFKVEGARLTTSNCKVLPTNCMRTNFLSIFFSKVSYLKNKKIKIIVFEIFSSQSIYGVSGFLECAVNKLKDPSLSCLLQKKLYKTST